MGILYEHEVYILDRALIKTDFRDEFIAVLGTDFIHYDQVAKEVLNIICLFSKFNQQALKSVEVTPEVYRRIHEKLIDAKTYESLSRKIRALCNQFNKEGLLIKDTKSTYTFDFAYKSPRH